MSGHGVCLGGLLSNMPPDKRTHLPASVAARQAPTASPLTLYNDVFIIHHHPPRAVLIYYSSRIISRWLGFVLITFTCPATYAVTDASNTCVICSHCRHTPRPCLVTPESGSVVERRSLANLAGTM